MRKIITLLLLFSTFSLFAKKANPCEVLPNLQAEIDNKIPDEARILDFTKQKYKTRNFEQEECEYAIYLNTAYYFFEKGETQRAIDLYEPLLEKYAHWEKEHWMAYLKIWFQVGEFYTNSEQLEQALPYYEHLQSLVTPEREAAYVASQEMPYIMAFRYWSVGDYAATAAINELLVRYLSPTDYSWNERILNNLAQSYARIGRLQEAVDAWDQALLMAQKREGDNGLSTCRLKIFMCTPLRLLNQHERAYQQLLDSQEYLQKSEQTNTEEYYFVLITLNEFYEIQFRFDLILENSDKLITYFKNADAGHIENYLNAIFQKVNALSHLKQFEEAEQLLEQAHEELLHFPHGDLTQRTIYSDYIETAAGFYLDKKEFDKVVAITNDYYNQLKAKGLDNTSTIVFTTMIMAKGYIGQKNYQKAIAIYEKVSPIIYADSGVQDLYWYAQVRLVELHLELQEYEAANQLVLHLDSIAWDWLDSYYLPLSESEQLRQSDLLRTYFGAIQQTTYAQPDSAYLQQIAFDNSILLKGLALNTRRRFWQDEKLLKNPELNQYYQEWQEINNDVQQELSLPVSKQSTLLREKQARLDYLDSYISNYLGMHLTSDELRVRYPAIQRSLAEDAAFIEVASFPEIACNMNDTCQYIRYVAYVVKKNKAHPIPVLLASINETEDFQFWRDLYRYDPEKKNWHNLIVKALLPHLEGINDLYISPAGLLHRINFGAIPYDSTTIMSEQFNLYQLGTGRDLVFQKTTDDTNKKAVLFGAINYDLDSTTTLAYSNSSFKQQFSFAEETRGLRKGGWKSLPYTAKEVMIIEQYLNKNDYQTTVYTGTNASEAAFKKIGRRYPSPRVLHLATHGFFIDKPNEEATIGFQSAGHPLVRTGLIMAGANQVWAGNTPEDGKEDGILTAYEIAQMDLKDTELVVLSACETGLGDIGGNEGVYGLQRAFKSAGVKYVLMSLWSVRDKQTQEFMTLFYEEWLENKKEIPQAYQAAQNAMKAKYAKPFNPNLWAGFILVE